MKFPPLCWWQQLGYVAALIWLIAACAPQPGNQSASPPSSPAASPKAQPSLVKAPAISKDLLRDDSDRFAQALNYGAAASKIAQSASSEIEWKDAIAKWTKAIALLKSVPKTDAKYAAAQQKISEYQRQLKFAQQKAAKK